ncbi:MAG TPA: hypothetical protein VHO72_14140 [Bacteroidales bacterium]|nr:hypothetical protein [Bacteroidales bacterium]
MRTKYILIILIACGLWGCKMTKNVAADKTTLNVNKVADNLAKSNAHPNGLATQGECLPQDKPFLDSLKRHLLKFDAGSYENEYIYMDSIPPILKKVFPNVIFFKSITWITSDAKPLYMAYYDKEKYFLSREFNTLFKKVQNNGNTIELEEKATAYLHLAIGYFNPIDVLSLEPFEIRLPPSEYTCNYKTEVTILNKKTTYLFYITNNQIASVFEVKDGKTIKAFYSDYERN